MTPVGDSFGQLSALMLQERALEDARSNAIANRFLAAMASAQGQARMGQQDKEERRRYEEGVKYQERLFGLKERALTAQEEATKLYNENVKKQQEDVLKQEQHGAQRLADLLNLKERVLGGKAEAEALPKQLEELTNKYDTWRVPEAQARARALSELTGQVPYQLPINPEALLREETRGGEMQSLGRYIAQLEENIDMLNKTYGDLVIPTPEGWKVAGGPVASAGPAAFNAQALGGETPAAGPAGPIGPPVMIGPPVPPGYVPPVAMTAPTVPSDPTRDYVAPEIMRYTAEQHQEAAIKRLVDQYRAGQITKDELARGRAMILSNQYPGAWATR